MNSGKPVSPTNEEVEAHILRLQKKHPKKVKIGIAGKTAEKRPIYVVTVTDSKVPAARKEHAMLIGGRHGNEESGRAICLAVLDWLVSKGGAETIRKQAVTIMPNCNPDGLEIDVYLPPSHKGTKYEECREDGIIKKVIDRVQPEMLVDAHARGGGGISYDMVLIPGTKPYTEDGRLFNLIADEMALAGEKAGGPTVVHPLTWPGWGGRMSDYAYWNFKSVAFLTEAAEHNEYTVPLKERARTGLARMKRLFSHGNRRHPRQYHDGYPIQLVGGLFWCGIAAVGKTAAARRASRVSIWKNIAKFPRAGTVNPDKGLEKTFRVQYTGSVLKNGAGLQIAARGKLKVKSISLNGRKLRQSNTNGYYSWQYLSTTYVVVALPELKRGKQEVTIVYRPD